MDRELSYFIAGGIAGMMVGIAIGYLIGSKNFVVVRESSKSGILPVKIERKRKGVTKNFIAKNVDATNGFRFFDIRSSGRLEEAVVVSKDPNFTVSLTIDDGTTMLTYDDAVEISKYSKNIDAFRTDDGNYVVVIGDIPFGKQARLDVIGRNLPVVKSTVYYER